MSDIKSWSEKAAQKIKNGIMAVFSPAVRIVLFGGNPTEGATGGSAFPWAGLLGVAPMCG